MIKVIKNMIKEDPEVRAYPQWTIYENSGNYRGSITKFPSGEWFAVRLLKNRFGIKEAMRRKCKTRKEALKHVYFDARLDTNGFKEETK